MLVDCWATVWVNMSCLLGAPISRPTKNHEQINYAVSLQPIHTPDLFIYIIDDLI